MTISELKNRLSAFLKKVRAGQEIVVLDRDEPVARIVAISDRGDLDDRLARLERTGLLRRASRRVSLASLREAAPRPKQSVIQALLDERRHGR